MGFWNYSNHTWEPAFELISPKSIVKMACENGWEV